MSIPSHLILSPLGRKKPFQLRCRKVTARQSATAIINPTTTAIAAQFRI